MSIKEHGPNPQGERGVVFKHTFCSLCKQCPFIMNEWDNLQSNGAVWRFILL